MTFGTRGVGRPSRCLLALLAAVVAGCAGTGRRGDPAEAPGLASGRELILSGRSADAVPVLRAALAREDVPGERAALLTELGDAERLSGRAQDSVSSYYRSRELEGRGALAFRNAIGTGQAYLDLGNPASAIRHLDEALAAAGDSAKRDAAHLHLARACLLLGRGTEARRHRDAIRGSAVAGLADLDRDLGRSAPPVSTERPAASRREPAANLPPEIIPRSRWHAAPLRRQNDPQAMGRIWRVTVHHTADVKAVPSDMEGVATRIRAYQSGHQTDPKKRWADIGYHFLIDPAGRIWEGRDLAIQGAHAGSPEANTGNIGVALMGNFERQDPPAVQKQALKTLLQWILARWSIPTNRIYAHSEIRRLHDIGATTCPGPRVLRYLSSLRSSLGPKTGGGRAGSP